MTTVLERKQKQNAFYEFARNAYSAKLNDLLRHKFNAIVGDNQQIDTNAVNLWSLNECLIPFITSKSSNLVDKANIVKCKYGQPETYNSLLPLSNLNFTEPIDIARNHQQLSMNLNPNIFDEQEHLLTIDRKHIHTLFAYDTQLNMSAPLVVFSKVADLEHGNLAGKKIQNSFFIDNTHNGDMNELKTFLDWLKKFKTSQLDDAIGGGRPTILFANTNVYLKLCCLAQNDEDTYNEMREFLEEYNIYILFYPVEIKSKMSTNAFETELREAWKAVLIKRYLACDLNTQVQFCHMYMQMLRDFLLPQANRHIFKEFFKVVLELGGCNLEVEVQSHLDQVKNNLTLVEQTIGVDENSSELEMAVESTPSTSNSTSIISKSSYKLSEDEINEYVEWIDEMSEIGCLTIRQAFMRDLTIKQQQQNQEQQQQQANNSQIQQQQSNGRENLLNEKKWFDFISKNRSKFSYQYSIGKLGENGYLLYWLDINNWRSFYYNRMVHKIKIKQADNLWTIQVIEFPLKNGPNANVIVKEPYLYNSNSTANIEAYATKNSRLRVSVIFAYNAAGDYIEPFFVYPENVADCSTTPNNDNDCCSSNGSVTCRIFENWIFQFFLKYLVNNSKATRGIQNYALLFYGYAPLIDKVTLTSLKEHNKTKQIRLNMFAVSHENVIPFNSLFKKNLRNRQVDLFQESWRKTLCNNNMSTSLKLKFENKQKFCTFFMNAFQNCIEEIGDPQSPSKKKPDAANSSSAVQLFREKMCESFETTKLWPLKHDEYKPFILKAEKNFTRKCAGLEDKKVEKSDDHQSNDTTSGDESQSDMELDNESELDDDESESNYEESILEKSSKRARTHSKNNGNNNSVLSNLLNLPKSKSRSKVTKIRKLPRGAKKVQELFQFLAYQNSNENSDKNKRIREIVNSLNDSMSTDEIANLATIFYYQE